MSDSDDDKDFVDDEQGIQLLDEVKDIDDRPALAERAQARSSTGPPMSKIGSIMRMLSMGIRNMDEDEDVAQPITDSPSSDDKTRPKGFMQLMSSMVASGKGSVSDDVEGQDGSEDKKGADNFLAAFDRKEFRAVFAFVSNGVEDIETAQVEDIWAALGYTLFPDDLKRLLLDVGTNKDGRVSIANLERTYASWRRNNTEQGRAMRIEYEKNLKMMFKMLMMEKRIPSVYRVKDIMEHPKLNLTKGDGLDSGILRNILAQTDLDSNVFDHDDITEDCVKHVLKELVTYAPSDFDKRKGFFDSMQSATHQEDAETVSERDFVSFMAFR